MVARVEQMQRLVHCLRDEGGGQALAGGRAPGMRHRRSTHHHAGEAPNTIVGPVHTVLAA
jgi:hypothetical protein